MERINRFIIWWKFPLFTKRDFYKDLHRLNLTRNMTSDWLYLYGALRWSSRSRRSTLLPSNALSSGVLLQLFFKLMSAPLSTNSRATSVLLFSAALWNGVLHHLFCLFTSAPACSRCLMTSVWLYLVAWRRAVPSQSLTSTGIPSCNNRSTALTLPNSTALRKLLTSCWSVSRYEKRLDAN